MINQPGNYQELLDAADVAECLPNIVGQYRRTSDPTIKYNCLAWAVGADWAWFDPFSRCAGYYWPDGIDREWTVPAIRKLLALFGYNEESATGELEEGYVKIAFFVDRDGIPTHFARQLSNGTWTSKLGELVDVEHANLNCISGEEPYYGAVDFYLKRRTIEGR